MDDFVQGFIKGAKETPLGFFAPAIAIWRLLLDRLGSCCDASRCSAMIPPKNLLR
jgi:hypothetical protein